MRPVDRGEKLNKSFNEPINDEQTSPGSAYSPVDSLWLDGDGFERLELHPLESQLFHGVVRRAMNRKKRYPRLGNEGDNSVDKLIFRHTLAALLF